MHDLVNLPVTPPSVSFDPNYLELRRVSLYCMALFNLDTGNARVFTFLNNDKCLEVACCFRAMKRDIHIDMFSRILYVTPSHPLYKFGEPLNSKSYNPVKYK